MTNEDYREILALTRTTLSELGLGAVDERIMSDMRGTEGAFWDLTYYLKHLTEEVALGGDAHLGNVLRRVRRHVTTESGEPIQGVRVLVSEEDRERYGTPQFDLKPDPELGRLAQELGQLIEDLSEDHRGNSERQGET